MTEEKQENTKWLRNSQKQSNENNEIAIFMNITICVCVCSKNINKNTNAKRQRQCMHWAMENRSLEPSLMVRSRVVCIRNDTYKTREKKATLIHMTILYEIKNKAHSVIGKCEKQQQRQYRIKKNSFFVVVQMSMTTTPMNRNAKSGKKKHDRIGKRGRGRKFAKS